MSSILTASTIDGWSSNVSLAHPWLSDEEKAMEPPLDPELDSAAHPHPAMTDMPRLARLVTLEGYPADFSQPGVPSPHVSWWRSVRTVVRIWKRRYRVYGNPLPLGLASVGYVFFLLAMVNLGAAGVRSVNVLVPVLVLFGGITQTLAAWWEMIIGHTFMATVFGTYGALALTYGALYLPAFGVMAAYEGKDAEFAAALSLFFFTWMILFALVTAAALRTSLAILATLVFTTFTMLSLGVHSLTASEGAQTAAGILGLLAAVNAWWAAMSGYWTPDVTAPWVRLPVLSLHSMF